jgi:CubicO group peptidase (beta-lactamase class C family)
MAGETPALLLAGKMIPPSASNGDTIMSRKRNLLAVLFLLCFALSALAQKSPKLDLSKANRPEDAGFSSERLARITQFFQGEVDKGAIPGAVLLVARNGKVVYDHAIGYQDREKKIPMKPDAIFRIFSMSKPITTVAVMMLAEEGKIDLLAPASQYLPEFKDLKVAVEKTDPATGKTVLALEDPKRPMTVQDLLRHTSGLVYGPFGHTLVHDAYNKANLFDNGQTLAEMVTKLAKLPLAHQPGTVWEYGMSVDVLARIVEVVSGMPFDRFIAERITTPLGMRDTAFYLNSAQAPRLAEPQVDATTGKRPPWDEAADLTKDKIKWFSGGGGLLSTAWDYARFSQMLVNGGELDGIRLLSPKTIALMTSDQLLPGTPRVGDVAVTQDLSPVAEMGQSFGLGFAVRTDPGRSPVTGSAGDYFWAGAAGTYFWIDPQEKLFAVLMLQKPFLEAGYCRRALRETVYGALVK